MARIDLSRMQPVGVVTSNLDFNLSKLATYLKRNLTVGDVQEVDMLKYSNFRGVAKLER